MHLSWVLAVAMLIYPKAVPRLQDSAKPESGQSTAPPSERARPETEKKETPAEPAKSSEGEKKSDDLKKSDETPKTTEAQKPTPTSNQPAKKAGRKDAKTASQAEPRKIVIRRGGTLEPNAQISPDIPPEEAVRQRQTAEDMLVAAEDRLKMLAGRTLETPQQETRTQVRNYMEKARSALREGDTQRGHTLALKAYLLADDLVKH